MRKTWDTIRTLTGIKKRREDIPSYFKHNNKIFSNSSDIAEQFNEFFTGIGPELADSIGASNRPFTDFLGDQVLENFIFANITPAHLSKIIGTLKTKNSSGPDFISTKLLKLIFPIIVCATCLICHFNLVIFRLNLKQQR